MSITKRLTVSTNCRFLFPLRAGNSGGPWTVVKEDTTVDMALCLRLMSVLSHDLLECDIQVKYLLEMDRQRNEERE